MRVLRTVDHALALREQAEPGTRVVVVGSGFIGCEAAASLRARGCAVALLSEDPAPQEPRLGPEVGARLAAWLDEAGVAARYEASVVAIRNGADGPLRVEASAGRRPRRRSRPARGRRASGERPRPRRRARARRG